MEHNPSSDISKTTLRESVLSEGILIGLVTLIGYICAFSFEAGYSSVFKIPLSFISINIIQILVAVSAVAISSLFLFFAANLISLTGITSNTALGRRLLFFLYSLIFALFLTMLEKRLSTSVITLLICIGVYAFFDLVWPIFTQKQVKGYLQKLEADDESEAKWERRSLFSRFINRFGINMYRLAFALFMIPYISFYIGKSQAKSETEFLIIKSERNPKTLVVLKNYSDKLLCAPLVEGQKKIKSQFYILQLNSKEIILEPAKIGPLTLEETSVNKTKRK